MHAAPITSARLAKVLKVLKDGKPHSTRDINRRTSVLAINTCVSELRQRGARVDCWRERIGGRGRWFYRMTEAPKDG